MGKGSCKGACVLDKLKVEHECGITLTSPGGNLSQQILCDYH